AYLRTHHKTLAAQIERGVRHQPTDRERVELEDAYLKRKRIDLTWTKFERIEVGNWAFHACLQAIPEIVVEDGDRCPCLTEHAYTLPWFTLRAEHEPSDQPPPPWSWFYNLKRQPFLRHGAVEEPGPRVHMAAVSYLQSIGWTINEPVFNFV